MTNKARGGCLIWVVLAVVFAAIVADHEGLFGLFTWILVGLGVVVGVVFWKGLGEDMEREHAEKKLRAERDQAHAQRLRDEETRKKNKIREEFVTQLKPVLATERGFTCDHLLSDIPFVALDTTLNEMALVPLSSISTGEEPGTSIVDVTFRDLDTFADVERDINLENEFCTLRLVFRDVDDPIVKLDVHHAPEDGLALYYKLRALVSAGSHVSGTTTVTCPGCGGTSIGPTGSTGACQYCEAAVHY
ncbi:MAG: hypothetical protein LBH13_00600 [Cellulomonadaceae bacterium]|jgi:hypothetical protein|nr:hypothetical protein [Cellulomonadaceae bacterium]